MGVRVRIGGGEETAQGLLDVAVAEVAAGGFALGADYGEGGEDGEEGVLGGCHCCCWGVIYVYEYVYVDVDYGIFI